MSRKSTKKGNHSYRIYKPAVSIAKPAPPAASVKEQKDFPDEHQVDHSPEKLNKNTVEKASGIMVLPPAASVKEQKDFPDEQQMNHSSEKPNKYTVEKASDIMALPLAIYVCTKLQAYDGDDWWKKAYCSLKEGKDPAWHDKLSLEGDFHDHVRCLDVLNTIKLATWNYNTVFARELGPDVISYLYTAKDIRNRISHIGVDEDLSDEEVLYYSLLPYEKILTAIGSPDAQKIRTIREAYILSHPQLLPEGALNSPADRLYHTLLAGESKPAEAHLSGHGRKLNEMPQESDPLKPYLQVIFSSHDRAEILPVLAYLKNEGIPLRFKQFPGSEDIGACKGYLLIVTGSFLHSPRDLACTLKAIGSAGKQDLPFTVLNLSSDSADVSDKHILTEPVQADILNSAEWMKEEERTVLKKCRTLEEISQLILTVLLPRQDAMEFNPDSFGSAVSYLKSGYEKSSSLTAGMVSTIETIRYNAAQDFQLRQGNTEIYDLLLPDLKAGKNRIYAFSSRAEEENGGQVCTGSWSDLPAQLWKKDNEFHNLFIQGNWGSGKSTVSAALFRLLSRNDPHVLTIQLPTTELSAADHPVFRHVIETYTAAAEDTFENLKKKAEELLHSMENPAVILIDGLDEMEDASFLCKELLEMNAYPNIHFILTARQIPSMLRKTGKILTVQPLSMKGHLFPFLRSRNIKDSMIQKISPQLLENPMMIRLLVDGVGYSGGRTDLQEESIQYSSQLMQWFIAEQLSKRSENMDERHREEISFFTHVLLPFTCLNIYWAHPGMRSIPASDMEKAMEQVLSDLSRNREKYSLLLNSSIAQDLLTRSNASEEGAQDPDYPKDLLALLDQYGCSTLNLLHVQTDPLTGIRSYVFHHAAWNSCFTAVGMLLKSFHDPQALIGPSLYLSKHGLSLLSSSDETRLDYSEAILFYEELMEERRTSSTGQQETLDLLYLKGILAVYNDLKLSRESLEASTFAYRHVTLSDFHTGMKREEQLKYLQKISLILSAGYSREHLSGLNIDNPESFHQDNIAHMKEAVSCLEQMTIPEAVPERARACSNLGGAWLAYARILNSAMERDPFLQIEYKNRMFSAIHNHFRAYWLRIKQTGIRAALEAPQEIQSEEELHSALDCIHAVWSLLKDQLTVINDTDGNTDQLKFIANSLTSLGTDFYWLNEDCSAANDLLRQSASIRENCLDWCLCHNEGNQRKGQIDTFRRGINENNVRILSNTIQLALQSGTWSEPEFTDACRKLAVLAQTSADSYGYVDLQNLRGPIFNSLLKASSLVYISTASRQQIMITAEKLDRLAAEYLTHDTSIPARKRMEQSLCGNS